MAILDLVRFGCAWLSAVVAVTCGVAARADMAEPAAFVGAAACAECHRTEAERWGGSHHARAMQVADAAAVRGDFSGATFAYAGTTSTFFRRDGKFFVRTDGPGGDLREYEIAYTFGFYPLQQYLIAFPGGRHQALGIAWDDRPATAGGQRWFHLYPDEKVTHDDVLHWTRPSQNWNGMCADCHSTDLRRGYRAATDTFETAWSEINVACEACHGPGSRHVAWARAGAPAADPSQGLVVSLAGGQPAQWAREASAQTAHRVPPLASGAQVEACAPCHARRSALRDPAHPGAPFLDSYRPALLAEGLYHPDGQIEDEVYEYGSFAQSRMFHAGVTCSDCHDPHSLALRAEGNALCSTCHAPNVFDTTAHHHHRPGTAGAACVDCHMPSKLYMVIDARRDHGLRVPRPDLSATIGVPNACATCHADRPAAWAAEAIQKWPGTTRWREAHYGEAIAAGRRGSVGAAEGLAGLVDDAAKPGIVRATAASLLAGYPSRATLPVVQRALRSDEPLVRLGALDAIGAFDPAARRDLALPLVADPLLAVRIEAARALAALPSPPLLAAERASIEGALAEYRAAQAVQGDRAEAHVNLAVLALDDGRLDEAERELQTALRVGPMFVPGYVNLADLRRAQGRDGEGEELLRRAIALAPDGAAAHHALGLLLIRQKRVPEALRELEKAVELDPDGARYAYVLGIALHSTGSTPRALEMLRRAHERRPSDRDLLVALATISRDAGASVEARSWAGKLVALDPADPAARGLLAELSAASAR